MGLELGKASQELVKESDEGEGEMGLKGCADEVSLPACNHNLYAARKERECVKREYDMTNDRGWEREL